MNCTEAWTHCHTFLDRQLDSACDEEVQSHIGACCACARRFDRERAFLVCLKRALIACAPRDGELHARVLLIVGATDVAQLARLARRWRLRSNRIDRISRDRAC